MNYDMHNHGTKISRLRIYHFLGGFMLQNNFYNSQLLKIRKIKQKLWVDPMKQAQNGEYTYNLEKHLLRTGFLDSVNSEKVE